MHLYLYNTPIICVDLDGKITITFLNHSSLIVTYLKDHETVD